MNTFKYLMGRYYEPVEQPLYCRVAGYDGDDIALPAKTFQTISTDLMPTPRCPTITEQLKAGVNFGKYAAPPLNGTQCALYEEALVRSTLDRVISRKPADLQSANNVVNNNTNNENAN